MPERVQVPNRRSAAWKKKAGRVARPLPQHRKPCLTLSHLPLLDRLGRLRLGTIDELHERHRRLVADAKAELQNPQISARTRLVARAKLVEELRHDVAIAQPREREAAIRERRFLAE